MLQWLYDQVSWLIKTASDAYNWIVGFVQNPYPAIHNLLDWLYDRAVYYVNAVKTEIANWTYKLVLDIHKWIGWFNSLYNNVIGPAIAEINNFTHNLGSTIGYYVGQAFNGLIGWISDRLNDLTNFANYVLAFAVAAKQEIANWVYGLFSDLLARVSWIQGQITAFDPTDIYKKVSELYWFVSNIEKVILKTVLDNLLDWLEDRLGEAME